MLFGVFVTAIYTLRVTWLVFYGKPRSQLATHETPNAMRVALGVLAVGALTSWLLAGPLATLLESSLPYHAQHAETTLEMAVNVIRSPGTAVALIVTLLALLVWQGRNTWLLWLVDLLRVPARAAASDFGFEWVNRRVMALAQKAAAVARTTQTGQLNWNAAGIVIGLLVVLVILTLGGTK
jgi:NADH-quinone oxidoreductase subunit L